MYIYIYTYGARDKNCSSDSILIDIPPNGGRHWMLTSHPFLIPRKIGTLHYKNSLYLYVFMVSSFPQYDT